MSEFTDEEHEARALMLGMYYHKGNGMPFYYKVGTDGIPMATSIIDADTLADMMDPWMDKGDFWARANKMMWDDFGEDRLPGCGSYPENWARMSMPPFKGKEK